MRWPWHRRAEALAREAEAAEREREQRTTPLTDRASAAVAEAVRFRSDNHFQQSLAALMRKQAP